MGLGGLNLFHFLSFSFLLWGGCVCIAEHAGINSRITIRNRGDGATRGHIWSFFDGDRELKAIEGLEETMAGVNFWDDQASAQKVISELNRLKAKVLPIRDLMSEFEDVRTMLELIDESEDPSEKEAYSVELIESLEGLKSRLIPWNWLPI